MISTSLMWSGACESSQKLTVAKVAEFLFCLAHPSDTNLTFSYSTQSVELRASKMQEAIVSESLRNWFSVQQYEVTLDLSNLDLLMTSHNCEILDIYLTAVILGLIRNLR